MVLIDSNSTVLKTGDTMPHFMLPSTDGGTVDSDVLTGKAFVIVFTCNHCPYAQAVEPRLIALGEEFRSENVQFVLICSNDALVYPDDSFEAMAKRATDKQYPFPYCQDATQEVAKSFGALCTPHCFVFDHEKKLRYKGRVDDHWKDEAKVTKRELKDSISALLEGKNPTVAEANAMGCSMKWR